MDDGTRIEAESVVRDLNTTMQWLSYPGRRNRVVKAGALHFADADGALHASAEGSSR